LKMSAKSLDASIWLMITVVLAGIGWATFAMPDDPSEAPSRDTRPLAGSPLVGTWSGQQDLAQYRLNITPSVLYFTSVDESEICEIEILSHERRDEGGRLRGVIRLDRTGGSNLPHKGCQVVVSYKLCREELELSWDHSPELSSRFEENEVILVRGSKSRELATTHEDGT
jgi:hypothetical protein